MDGSADDLSGQPGEKETSWGEVPTLVDVVAEDECTVSPVTASVFSMKQETRPSVEREEGKAVLEV